MYQMKKTGRTWGIYRRNELVEGGFFGRAAAEEAMDRWEASEPKSRLHPLDERRIAGLGRDYERGDLEQGD